MFISKAAPPSKVYIKCTNEKKNKRKKNNYTFLFLQLCSSSVLHSSSMGLAVAIIYQY